MTELESVSAANVVPFLYLKSQNGLLNLKWEQIIRMYYIHCILIYLFWCLPDHVTALRAAEVHDIKDDLGIIVPVRVDLADEDPVELRMGVCPEGGAVRGLSYTAGNLLNIG